MNRLFLPILAIITLFWAACDKDPDPTVPTTKNPYEIVFDNKFSVLENTYAAFLSDSNGKTLAFRWLNGNDTTRLIVEDYTATSLPDLTVVRVQKVEATGSGIVDTSVTVNTYTGVKSGTKLLLKKENYLQTTLLNFTLTGVTQVDSIIVPDGLTFTKPSAINNFNGIYSVQHTGKIWMRLRVNGNPSWRYMVFNDVNSDQLTATLPIGFLPIQAYPKPITMPYITNWKFRVDGVIDTAARKYLALGDLSRAPGGATISFSELGVFEPIPFDPIPNPLPYSGFRVKLSGVNIDGNGYLIDQYFSEVPATLPSPPFSISPGVLSDNRLVALSTTGSFDALVISRKNDRNPSVLWETYHPATANMNYRLPDVPDALGRVYVDLKVYNFGQKVNARAESYQRKNGYEDVLKAIFGDSDPFWQAKAGLTGVEKVL